MFRGLKLASVLAIAGTLGCGSKDSTSPVLNTGNNIPCNITISGAQTGSGTCAEVITVWASASNTGAVSMLFTGSPTLNAAVSFTGEPSAKTYKDTDTGAESALIVQSGVTSAWAATVGGVNQHLGSYTLTLTSVGTAVTVATGKTYTAHGTLDVTAPAVAGTGSTGTVTVHITF